MIKSPKEKFQASATRRDEWERIVQSQTFEDACDYALLQMQSAMPNYTADMQNSVCLYHQLIGAQRVLQLLKQIHEIQQPPTKPTEQGLNYQAGV